MLLTALAALLASSTLQAPARDFSTPIRDSKVRVEAMFAKEKIPGGAVAVTVADDVVWHAAFGVTDLASKAAVAAATRFRVGSLTKLLTAAALLRLSDQERLHLDDPVGEYLPDFPHGDVTLRQLAGHLSGIRHYTGSEFLNATHYESATDSLRKFAADPLLAPPGEKYVYSSYGYDVLGAVIERVTEQRFDAAVKALVLEPLGMSATSFTADSETASFYDASDAGPVAAPANDLSDRLPAGAALSTAQDLARFLCAMSDGRFLSADALAEITTVQVTSEGKATSVGVAWRVGTDEAGRTFLHHGGAVTGGRAFALLYPRERVAVAIVTNLGFAAFDEKDALAIAARFLE